MSVQAGATVKAMPVASVPDAAYTALTQGCALVTGAEDGKLALTGAQAAEFLGGQVTNDTDALTPGQGQYAALLTNKGKMLADLRVLDTGEELLLLTERATLQVLFDTLRRAVIGWDAELHKRTLDLARLTLIGPAAARVAGAEPGPEEHDNARAQIAGRDVLLVRTDSGLDVLAAAGDEDAVRDALTGAGAIAVDAAAADVVRVEHGRPRYGVDLDDRVIPQEAGLNERAVSFTKGCYVGQETVARLHYKGKPNRHLRGLRLSEPGQPGDAVRVGEREVGRLGSVAVSPVHGPIALAIVRREVAPGDVVTVGDDGASATVAELPF
jgi:folate-binding protein YgfZ